MGYAIIDIEELSSGLWKGFYRMYIIAGLGNPGREYGGTRHNIGFAVIDELADKYNISMDIKKHKAVCGKGIIDGQKVILVKPQTYMNLSGESIREVADFYKSDIEEELIVLFDDISLDVGKIRVRPKGSAGGHNGIKSIIAHTGTEKFKRVKIGVGDKPRGYELSDWVLGRFAKEDLDNVHKGISDACNAVSVIITEGVESGMNRFN